MKHKVSELTGALLDAAVAKAEGMAFDIIDHIPLMDAAPPSWCKANGQSFRPSESPTVGLSLLEAMVDGTEYGKLRISGSHYHGWHVQFSWGPGRDGDGETPAMFGETMLTAGMRCLVARRFGEEVELP